MTQLEGQHGCIWTSENFTDRRYPPPNLQALLKLVLVPHMDNMSVQALVSIQIHQQSPWWSTMSTSFPSIVLTSIPDEYIFWFIYGYSVLKPNASQLMYFVLDMGNFLQCKDDLLQAFCHAFTISLSFSQQIRAFWMLDHGHIKVYNREAKKNVLEDWVILVLIKSLKWTYASRDGSVIQGPVNHPVDCISFFVSAAIMV